MPSSSSRDAARLLADLNDLLQLDHDAVEAYTIAIDAIRDAARRERLVAFRADHKRHIEELAALVRGRGGLPVELPHATGPLKLAVQSIGAAAGDTALLLAFKAVEGQARDKYRRFARNDYPDDVARVVTHAAADEEEHYAWCEQVLREMGAGAGTIPHAVAGAVETVHKAIADPVERVGREVMRAVGEVVGTRQSRGGRAAPSPADAASAAEREVMSTMDASRARGAADASRFIDALRRLEDQADVEGMAALFGAEAEVSNPMAREPHRGAEGARAFWRTYRDSFEEIHSDFSKVVQAGDTAMLEWTSEGRLKGGAPVRYSGVSVLELDGDKVRRFRTYFDPTALETRAPSDR